MYFVRNTFKGMGYLGMKTVYIDVCQVNLPLPSTCHVMTTFPLSGVCIIPENQDSDIQQMPVPPETEFRIPETRIEMFWLNVPICTGMFIGGAN